MQIFSPYSDFKLIANCLDDKRLQKQKVEIYQILKVISLGDNAKGWKNHPAVSMARGFEEFFIEYAIVIANKCIEKGWKDTLLPKIKSFKELFNKQITMPWYWGLREFHISHQSNLIRKKPEHYTSIFGHVPNNLDYWWPSKNDIITIPRKLQWSIINDRGAKEFYADGKLHREDGPAVEWPSGSKEWYRDGLYCREDGPAIEWANGDKEWYINGKLHREDGPAFERNNGDKFWYKTGEYHRDGGPSIEYANGDKYWYRNGKQHREDGPAVERADGSVEWWYEGRKGLEHFPLELKKKFTGKFIHGT